MRFRLTYSGLLLSSGNDAEHKKADHKHELRLAFHPQLKRLWEITPFLKSGRSSWNNGTSWASNVGRDNPDYSIQSRAKEFQERPWNFVPLVAQDMEFHCGLDILLMRANGGAKSIMNQGDIDGRLKTLLDALSIPDANQGYSDRKFEQANNPLFVLLENDRQITKVVVETDQLLQSVHPGEHGNYGINDARVQINVHLSPVEPANWSMPFL